MSPPTHSFEDRVRMQESRARVVLLGASNLARGMATLVETTRSLLGAPLDIQFVAGHGRSYGLDTLILVRRLPSILGSSVWRRLQCAPPARTYALITDIGNDIMLGVEPELLANWVRICVRRLEQSGARIVITAPPMARIARLGPREYKVARTLLFPMNRLTQAQALGRARQVDAMLRDLASQHDVTLVDPYERWYGIDPIHIRMRSRGEAWETVLSHWLETPSPQPGRLAGATLSRWLEMRSSSPDRWWLFGRIPRGRTQPCIRLSDGTTVSLR
jgi:hypothetical protein